MLGLKRRIGSADRRKVIPGQIYSREKGVSTWYQSFGLSEVGFHDRLLKLRPLVDAFAISVDVIACLYGMVVIAFLHGMVVISCLHGMVVIACLYGMVVIACLHSMVVIACLYGMGDKLAFMASLDISRISREVYVCLAYDMGTRRRGRHESFGDKIGEDDDEEDDNVGVLAMKVMLGLKRRIGSADRSVRGLKVYYNVYRSLVIVLTSVQG
ncbi:hypothetical protein Tco_1065187 [Tanacetum coccineum]